MLKCDNKSDVHKAPDLLSHLGIKIKLKLGTIE